MNKLITVGIPSFNRVDGLRNTLKNMCAQSYQNLEILVSDNCSDNSVIAEVVKQFVLVDSRVVYYRQNENVGAYRNIEFLTKMASGEYFLIASDDDSWPENYIEVLAKKLDETSDAGLSVSSSIIFRTGVLGLNNYTEQILKANFLQYCEPDARIRVFGHLSKPDGNAVHLVYGLWRTSIAKKAFSNVLKMYSDPVATDVQLVLFLLCQGRISITEDTHKIYLVHPNSTGFGFSWSYKKLLHRYQVSMAIVIEAGLNNGEKNAANILEKKIKYLWIDYYLISNFKNFTVKVLTILKLHNFYISLKRLIRQK